MASLRTLLEQHWLHCRHLESERAWFMSVYAAIVGGMLAYYFTGNVRESWLLYFLMFLTLFGFLLNFRWSQAFEHHRRQIKKVASDLGIIAEVDIPAKHIWKIPRTRYLFPSFYTIIFIGLSILLITTNLSKG